MFARHHVTQRPVRQALKITREAVNHALDVAEPRIERAACDFEDLSRDALKSLRKRSAAQLDDLLGGYGRLEKKMRKRLPATLARQRFGKLALIAAGVAILAFGIFRSS